MGYGRNILWRLKAIDPVHSVARLCTRPKANLIIYSIIGYYSTVVQPQSLILVLRSKLLSIYIIYSKLTVVYEGLHIFPHIKFDCSQLLGGGGGVTVK